MWTQARITFYLTTAISLAGTLLVALDWATFNAATGMIDFKPFNAYWLAPPVAGVLAPIMAAVAAKLGWGPK